MFEIVLIMFITMSLTEILKRAKFVRRGYVPLFVVIFAIFAVAGYGSAHVFVRFGSMPPGALTTGVLIGLLCCGTYSCAKAFINAAQTFKEPYS